MITRIHVNQHKIRSNAKLPEGSEPLPCLSVKQKGKVYPAFEATIQGPSTIIYRPDKPLSCGAKVWVETTSEVTIR